MTRRVFYTQPKQPGDIIHIPGIDWLPELTLTGEVISSIADGDVTIFDRFTSENVTAAMLVTGSVGVSDNVVAFQIKDGSDNHDYLVRLKPETSLGRIVEGDVILPVRLRK